MIDAPPRRALVCLAAFVAIIVVLSSSGRAEVTITVQPTLAPNLYSSPNKEAYAENLLAMLETGGEQFHADDPAAAVSVRDRYTAGEVICASFPLWRGQACPGGALDKEFGNRVQFAVRIMGNGQKFRMSDLSYRMTTSNPAMRDLLSGQLNNVKFDWMRVGIDYGPDGRRDTGDDIIYNNEQEPTLLIDELLYVGAGIGWQPDKEDWPGDGPRPAKTAEVLQPVVNKTAVDLTEHKAFEVTNVYTLASPDDPSETLASNQTSITVLGFPEPDEPMMADVSPRTMLFAGVAAVGLIALVIVAGVLKEQFFPSKGV